MFFVNSYLGKGVRQKHWTSLKINIQKINKHNKNVYNYLDTTAMKGKTANDLLAPSASLIGFKCRKGMANQLFE